ALVTRLNAFLQGHSGVRSTLVNIVQAMLNRGVVPLVPLRGSVGASGDLCPLSHLFATLLGVGKFYVLPEAQARVSVPHREASELPALLGFKAEEMKPTFKEGLALVNGVNFSASMLALGVHDAERLADLAAAAAALTMEAMCGCTRALDPKVQESRVSRGATARLLRRKFSRPADRHCRRRSVDRPGRAGQHLRAADADAARWQSQSPSAAESDGSSGGELRPDDHPIHRRVFGEREQG